MLTMMTSSCSASNRRSSPSTSCEQSFNSTALSISAELGQLRTSANHSEACVTCCHSDYDSRIATIPPLPKRSYTLDCDGITLSRPLSFYTFQNLLYFENSGIKALEQVFRNELVQDLHALHYFLLKYSFKLYIYVKVQD